MKDYNRNVPLICPVCGNDQFSTPDLKDTDSLIDAPDDTRIQCSDCKNIFTKAQLLQENQEVINANIDEMTDEVIKDFDKEWEKQMKKFLK